MEDCKLRGVGEHLDLRDRMSGEWIDFTTRSFKISTLQQLLSLVRKMRNI
jgi:hypothetical protein